MSRAAHWRSPPSEPRAGAGDATADAHADDDDDRHGDHVADDDVIQRHDVKRGTCRRSYFCFGVIVILSASSIPLRCGPITSPDSRRLRGLSA